MSRLSYIETANAETVICRDCHMTRTPFENVTSLIGTDMEEIKVSVTAG